MSYPNSPGGSSSGSSTGQTRPATGAPSGTQIVPPSGSQQGSNVPVTSIPPYAGYPQTVVSSPNYTSIVVDPYIGKPQGAGSSTPTEITIGRLPYDSKDVSTIYPTLPFNFSYGTNGSKVYYYNT